jgi:hypothetical protein
MPNRVYALLVGINDYAPEVGALAGCLNDVDRCHEYLRQHVDPAALAVEVLKDGDATRGNIIQGFRSHLGQAVQGDVAVFQYCGHGARWASSRAFREFYPDGRDEGLVCFDSRQPGGYDLADKELAVLLAEVARRDAHVAVLLDCCHSGSGTRGVDAFRGLKPRLTHEVTTERPLESYLDGHYAALRDGRQPLFIPTARHILLAACERGQLAQESADRSGVFTSTLFEVLEKSGRHLSYAELFVRCRAAVRSRAYDQDPQFEAYDRFDASSGFLARTVARTARRYSVSFDRGAWSVDCGALHGVPTEPETMVTLALYGEADAVEPAGTARALQVGAQKSEIELDFDSAEGVRYRAEITSLPAAPMLVAFSGDGQTRDAVQAALDLHGALRVRLVDAPGAVRHLLAIDDGRLVLGQSEPHREIGFVDLAVSTLAQAAAALAPVLAHLQHWEHCLALRNHHTSMETGLVDFVFAEQLDGTGEHTYPGAEVTLDYTRTGGQWRQIRGRFKARNRTAQTLHVVLAYFSAAYGIHILRNDTVGAGDAWMTLWGDDPNDYFYLEDGVDESLEQFMLMVTTEKVDDFLLAQEELVLGGPLGGTRAIGSLKPQHKTVHENEWFTRHCRLRVVRRLDQLGAADTSLAGGRIVVKAHPTATANVSLSAAAPTTRGAGQATGFHTAFEQRGMVLLNFVGSRGGGLSVLELTDLQHASSLADDPLEIEVRLPLADNEGILPVVYDGQHVFLGGAPSKDADGVTHVLVDRIPEVADPRRSLGGALKLYFFKTWLKHDSVNLLRWVEFRADGTIEHQTAGVADRVAASRRVLLLVHGIIGDTGAMAEGVKACGLNDQFDLMLAYDYESLATPIGETARTLKAQLTTAGFRDGDDRHLTLLVHSMGGLVSRWFIEREGGNRMVDHLVMCGTPNHGSPFGRIDEARKVFSMLTSLALNYVPALIPFSTAALLLVNGSKRLTPALEQMHPASEFIRTLNQSEDPGIPYTILAGDVGSYRECTDPLFARLLAKAGNGMAFEALFADQAHDIAVGVESIFGVNAARRMPPVRSNVACHHLNYFVSEPGQRALKSVDW